MSGRAGSTRPLADGPGIGRMPASKLARHELARSIYRPSWPARILRDIGHWLSSLVSGSSSGRPNWWAIVLLTAVVVAASAALVYWLGPTRLSRRFSSRAVISVQTMTAAEHRDAAGRFAAAGNFQAAVIERIRAMAADLETRDVLPPRPARTAAELAAEAGTVFPAEATGLAHAARLFDEVRYGAKAGTQAGYAYVAAVDLRVQAAAARRLTASANAGGDGRGRAGLQAPVPVLTGTEPADPALTDPELAGAAWPDAARPDAVRRDAVPPDAARSERRSQQNGGAG